MPKNVRLPIVITILVAALAALIFFLWPPAAASTKTFGECLTEKGVTMYGADTCENCLEQKRLFGEDFSRVNYVNCAFQSSLCEERGIMVYPVWARDNNVLIGVQSLANLSEFSGCPLQSS